MSYDFAVTPPFGLVGRLLRDNLDWYAELPIENIATNVAMRNFIANILQVQPNVESVLPNLDRLLDRHSLNPRRTAALLKEWPLLLESLAAAPISSLVRVAYKEEEWEGEPIKDHGPTLTIRPPQEEIRDFAESNDRWAQSSGKPGFSTDSLADAFWFQLDMMKKVLDKAVELGRGVELC